MISLPAIASAATSAVGMATAPAPLKLYHRDEGVDGARGGAIETIFFRGNAPTDAAQVTDGLYMLIFWFSAFFFVLLMGLMVYWTIKYRRRPGVPASVSPSHNTALEIVWTIVPSAALLVIFFFGFWGYIDRQVATSDAYQLDIKAKMWAWTPVYENGASTQWFLPIDERVDPVSGNTIKSTVEAPVIIVPEDTNIRLSMSSSDVIHSFWIPDLRIKGDVFPNRYTGYTFKTPKLEPGQSYQDHWVFCAEYCGDKHGAMGAILRVMEYAEFDSTVAGWSGPLTGDKVAQQQGCIACHSIDGSAMAGPSWKNLYGYPGEFVNADPIAVKDETYIRESILEPDAKWTIRDGKEYRGGMNPYQGLVSEDELDALVRYIRSLSDKAPAVSEDGAEPAEDAEGGEGEEPEAADEAMQVSDASVQSE